MTALSEFERLEAQGVWRPGAEAQRRDVIVTIGDATLTIFARGDLALAHWSLPAMERVNPGRMPAVYRPGPDSPEDVEIADATMVEAIDRILSAVARARPHPGRLRLAVVAAVVLASVALAVFWLPGAMARHAAAILPAAARERMGEAMLDHARRLAGAPCGETLGNRALQKLAARAMGRDAGPVVVLPAGVRVSAHLPGGIILLNRSVVEDTESAEAVAGYLIAENVRQKTEDPVVRLLRERGMGATLGLLTTGELSAGTLDAHVETLLAADPDPAPDDRLLAAFAAAGVPSTPYAYALDVTGETTLPLIEADPLRGATTALLSDGEWVSLQGICGG